MLVFFILDQTVHLSFCLPITLSGFIVYIPIYICTNRAIKLLAYLTNCRAVRNPSNCIIITQVFFLINRLADDPEHRTIKPLQLNHLSNRNSLRSLRHTCRMETIKKGFDDINLHDVLDAESAFFSLILVDYQQFF